MKTFKHLLVPTDFSDTAREALHTALDLVRETPARLSIVNVIPDAWRQAWTAEDGMDLVALEQGWRTDAQRRLQALVTEEGLSTSGVVTAVLVGTPHAAILEYASGQHVDLIVMGAHGHGPIRRFLLGSVAERLTRAARCPVLVVPHHSLRDSESPVRGESSAAPTPERSGVHGP